MGRNAQNKPGQVPPDPECKRFYAIVTYSYHNYGDIEPEAGTGAVQQCNLMSLLFMDELSRDMTYLLQLSVPHALLLVESNQCDAAGDTRPHGRTHGKIECDKESTNPMPYKLCVVELEREVWKRWLRRSLKKTIWQSQSSVVEFVIESNNVAVQLYNLSIDSPKFASKSFDAVIRHLLSLRPDPVACSQYYQAPEQQQKQLLQEWFRTRRLPPQVLDIDWGVGVHGTAERTRHLAGGIKIFLFFREARILGPGAAASRGPASPPCRNERGNRQYVIWPSLCLHLGFATHLTGVPNVSKDSVWLSSITALLLANFEFKVEVPLAGAGAVSTQSPNSSSSASRLRHNQLTLSCACSSNPWAVAVREQRALGFSELGGSDGFRERRRGVDTEVKFVAESAKPQEIQVAVNLGVSATWDVLPHGHHPSMPDDTLNYNFTISQKLYPAAHSMNAADNSNVKTWTDHSWTTTLRISTRAWTRPDFMVECDTSTEPAYTVLRWPDKEDTTLKSLRHTCELFERLCAAHSPAKDRFFRSFDNRHEVYKRRPLFRQPLDIRRPGAGSVHPSPVRQNQARLWCGTMCSPNKGSSEEEEEEEEILVRAGGEKFRAGGEKSRAGGENSHKAAM